MTNNLMKFATAVAICTCTLTGVANAQQKVPSAQEQTAAFDGKKFFDELSSRGWKSSGDFDGKKFAEKPFSAVYDVQGTPTIQFFPEKADGLAALKGQAREVARMTGLPEKPEFLATFRYVREKAYEQGPFADWFKKQV